MVPAGNGRSGLQRRPDQRVNGASPSSAGSTAWARPLSPASAMPIRGGWTAGARSWSAGSSTSGRLTRGDPASRKECGTVNVDPDLAAKTPAWPMNRCGGRRPGTGSRAAFRPAPGHRVGLRKRHAFTCCSPGPITSLALMPDPDGCLAHLGQQQHRRKLRRRNHAADLLLRPPCLRGGLPAVLPHHGACRAGASKPTITSFPACWDWCGARVYYNLLNWYRLLALLPGFLHQPAFHGTDDGGEGGHPRSGAGRGRVDVPRRRLARPVAYGKKHRRAVVESFRGLTESIPRFYERLNDVLKRYLLSRCGSSVPTNWLPITGCSKPAAHPLGCAAGE